MERLQSHQQQIIRILADAQQPLAGEGAASLKAVGAVRWELMRALRAYQLFKHTEIFDPLVRQVASPKAAIAGRLKSRCIELADAYGDHVRRWSLQAPVSAWADYQREATAMSRRIAEHLTNEAAEVAKLLTGVARTRAIGSFQQ